MFFYGHEFFRTISDNCFRVTFIAGNEYHKSHDFREFCEFSSIWRKPTPKKFSFLDPFAKVDTYKEIWSNSFAKINERLVI